MMLEYFRTLAKRRGNFTVADESELKQVLVSQLGLISKIDFDTASEISIMLDGAEFLSEPTRALIDDMIHAKLGHSMPSKFRAIEDYQSAACWEVYESNMDDAANIHRIAIAMQMACLGITMEREETTFCEAAMVALPRTRATEICDMLCPECCMIEARPGCCIYPRGHQDNHYCGKCGCCDTSDFWQGAMSDTSSDTSSSDTSSTSPPSLL